MGNNSEITVRADGGVVTVTINRAAKRNALTTAMYTALADAFEAANEDPDVRVLVLTGSGGSFSAGNDLGDFLEAGSVPDGSTSPVRRFQESVIATKAVLIAAVDGPAVGIGATVLLHCDLVYATQRSYLLFPFVDLGLAPEFASSLLLPRLVGARRAAEILLVGARLPAQQAAELGLVNEVLPDPESLEKHIAETVTGLLAKPANSLRATVSLLRDTGTQTPRERLAAESDVFAELLRDPETQTRIRTLKDNRR